jgi:hypothetical protein
MLLPKVLVAPFLLLLCDCQLLLLGSLLSL